MHTSLMQSRFMTENLSSVLSVLLPPGSEKLLLVYLVWSDFNLREWVKCNAANFGRFHLLIVVSIIVVA